MINRGYNIWDWALSSISSRNSIFFDLILDAVYFIRITLTFELSFLGNVKNCQVIKLHRNFRWRKVGCKLPNNTKENFALCILYVTLCMLYSLRDQARGPIPLVYLFACQGRDKRRYRKIGPLPRSSRHFLLAKKFDKHIPKNIFAKSSNLSRICHIYEVGAVGATFSNRRRFRIDVSRF